MPLCMHITCFCGCLQADPRHGMADLESLGAPERLGIMSDTDGPRTLLRQPPASQVVPMTDCI